MKSGDIEGREMSRLYGDTGIVIAMKSHENMQTKILRQLKKKKQRRRLFGIAQKV